MRFKELPAKYQKIAIQQAVDAFNEIEIVNGSDYRYDSHDEAINEYLEEQEYEIEKGRYPDDVKREVLRRIW